VIKWIRYLKHFIGFHTKECIIPCDEMQNFYTCRYTLKDFKKKRAKK
jgi:hypothetical protein